MFEEGNYPMVADPVYLTSFIGRYAACLGLNELEASREFISETANSPAERLGKCSVSVGSRPGRSRPRLFKYYAGPLAVILLAWTVGPLSPLNLWTEKTPPRAPMMERRQEPSAILVAKSTEASAEPDPAATSPGLATPPTTELSPSPVEEPLPAAGKAEVADVSTSDHGPGAIESNEKLAGSSSTVESHRIATDKASDALRAEQLARMKAATVSAHGHARGDGA